MNFRKFFWTPDYNVYGFASGNQIKDTIAKWQKEDALRKLKEDKMAFANLKTSKNQIKPM